jgi:DNA polymerase V
MEMKIINHLLNKLIPIADELLEIEIPLLGFVSAGFPSEAYNYLEEGIDFNKLLVKHKETTFCLIAGGESLKGDGIFKGDLLVIDKLEEPYENSILVFSVNGEFTLKRLKYGIGYVELISSNPEYPTIIVREGEELKRWGVLKFAIKRF